MGICGYCPGFPLDDQHQLSTIFPERFDSLLLAWSGWCGPWRGLPDCDRTVYLDMTSVYAHGNGKTVRDIFPGRIYADLQRRVVWAIHFNR